MLLEETELNCSICTNLFSWDIESTDPNKRKRLPVLSRSNQFCQHYFCQGCIEADQQRTAENNRGGKVPKWLKCMECNTKTAFCPQNPKYHTLLIRLLQRWSNESSVVVNTKKTIINKKGGSAQQRTNDAHVDECKEVSKTRSGKKSTPEEPLLKNTISKKSTPVSSASSLSLSSPSSSKTNHKSEQMDTEIDTAISTSEAGGVSSFNLAETKYSKDEDVTKNKCTVSSALSPPSKINIRNKPLDVDILSFPRDEQRDFSSVKHKGEAGDNTKQLAVSSASLSSSSSSSSSPSIHEKSKNEHADMDTPSLILRDEDKQPLDKLMIGADVDTTSQKCSSTANSKTLIKDTGMGMGMGTNTSLLSLPEKNERSDLSFNNLVEPDDCNTSKRCTVSSAILTTTSSPAKTFQNKDKDTDTGTDTSSLLLRSNLPTNNMCQEQPVKSQVTTKVDSVGPSKKHSRRSDDSVIMIQPTKKRAVALMNNTGDKVAPSTTTPCNVTVMLSEVIQYCFPFVGLGNYLFVGLTCRSFLKEYQVFCQNVGKDPKETSLRQATCSLSRLHFSYHNRIRKYENLLCQYAAKNGSLEVLQYLRSKQPNGCCKWDKWTTALAAMGGHLNVLKWARSRGCPWDQWSCIRAARNGHLTTLKYLRAHGCPWDAKRILTYAAEGGHFHVLQWVCRKNYCTRDDDAGASACAMAAKGGYLEIVQFLLHQQQFPWDASMCTNAARNGHLHVLQWLADADADAGLTNQRKCEWNEQTTAMAAKGGHLQVLKFLHEQNCPWDEQTCMESAEGGFLNVLKFARLHKCPWDLWTCRKAARNGHLKILEYIRSVEGPWDPNACAAAQMNNHTHVVDWIHANHLPCGCHQI